ncbi:RNA ligase family protein [Bradyrhizobium sp. SZCCHNS3053]|uniref:RNA ligase family protein n=1 Tax=Bradyrhizobium sp. SZCCHNS3053 TaxID=3057322 RepID=UPI0029168384|nr:RNA ligase family protein [Bradyrhizobium sp. SZCCHNS3053]
MIDGERKLATIRRIADINPIQGADAIIKLTVDGWELVSAKDNGFAIGDLIVYFEIDSFLPVIPEFEFLRSRCFKSTAHLGDGFRLRTIKLRGQISQGLAMPLHALFGEAVMAGLKEGDDVTEALGVKKWESPPERNGSGFGPTRTKGNFPDFLRKTDQERIQNCFAKVKNWATVKIESEHLTELPEGAVLGTDIFQVSDGPQDGLVHYVRKKVVPLNDNELAERDRFEATMKLDGSSMTVYHNDGQYGVCSRNLDLKRDPENLFWKAAIKTRILPALVHSGYNVAIQGELMGPGVQGNREQLPDHAFFIFDVFDIERQEYMTPLDRWALLHSLVHEGLVDVDHMQGVPYLGEVKLSDFQSVKDFLAAASIPSMKHKVAEGIVYKSMVQGGPTFKAINDNFLLAEAN